jgi:predicted small secreted protein
LLLVHRAGPVRADKECSAIHTLTLWVGFHPMAIKVLLVHHEDLNPQNKQTPRDLMKSYSIKIIVLLFVAMLGTSCRTVRGIGQDVQRVGGHIENASHR